jgi:5-methylcytosine-specific restriction endonuclease McrA
MKGQTINCKYCGDSFVKRTTSNVFCSHECANTYQSKIGFRNSGEYATRYRIFERDKFRCIYCGKSSIEDGVKLEIDHVTPGRRGGRVMDNNLVTACQKCNKGKMANIPGEDNLERIYAELEKRETTFPL